MLVWFLLRRRRRSLSRATTDVFPSIGEIPGILKSEIVSGGTHKQGVLERSTEKQELSAARDPVELAAPEVRRTTQAAFMDRRS